MNTDMTVGKPSSVLWRFSLPMLISVAFQQLYSIADSIIAGNFIENGEDALAAIGASYPVTMLFMAVAVGVSSGCNVVASNIFGSKKYGRLRTAVTTGFAALGVLSLLLTVVGLIFCEWIITALGTPANVYEDSCTYLYIYIIGLVFLFFYNVCNGFFSALGDSKTPLYLLIGSSLGNIALDAVAVICLNMGVAGVAWATFAAQGISSVLATILLIRRIMKLPCEEKPPFFSAHTLGKIASVAIPSVLQQSFVSVGNLFIQGIINGYGSAAMAGYSSAIKLNTFVVTSVAAMSNGVSSFAAQNIGAGKLDRIPKGFRTSVIMSACVSIPVMLLYLIFGNDLIGLFMNSTDGTAVSIGYGFLLIVSPFYFAVTAKLNCDAVFKGSGAMLLFIITTFTDLILRVVLAYVFSGPMGMGIEGVWWSWPVGWVISAAISVCFYAFGTWKKHIKCY